MSVMPNSATYLAQTIRNGSKEGEDFHTYFECWIVEQNQHLQELVSASKKHEERREGGNTQTQSQGKYHDLQPLLKRVIPHYEEYYRAKSRWARNDILSMFNPSWRSNLEDAFLWIGGWRPSMAFHLLYSKSGLQLEARLDELIRGISTGDLGDLSSTQLEQVNKLQRETIKEEKEMTETFAEQQETVADAAMVKLSHAVTEMIMEGNMEGAMNDGRVEATLTPKEEGLLQILEKADALRLQTLKNVLNILNPIQSVHFLIAAAELHLRLHEWGKKKDARYHKDREVGHGQISTNQLT